MVGTPGFEPGISCTPIRQPSSTAFTQFLPFVALTRFWGVCFRSQRLRLARLMGEFPDGFLTVVAATGCAARFFSNGFRAAIAPLVVRVGFDEPREATFPNHHPLLRIPQQSCSDRSSRIFDLVPVPNGEREEAQTDCCQGRASLRRTVSTSGFIVTNMNLPNRSVVRFYNERGTAEQWIKEGKHATNWTRLSCHRFHTNEVRLHLSVLAYNLRNLWRRLVLPRRIVSWSLTSVQQRLVKTVGSVVKHARYYWLMLAESHLTRLLFEAMLRRIWPCRYRQAEE